MPNMKQRATYRFCRVDANGCETVLTVTVRPQHGDLAIWLCPECAPAERRRVLQDFTDELRELLVAIPLEEAKDGIGQQGRDTIAA